MVAMNRPSLEKFEPKIQPRGFLLINRTLIEIPHKRQDIEAVYLDITAIAARLGNPRLANIVALGGLIARVPVGSKDAAMEALADCPARKPRYSTSTCRRWQPQGRPSRPRNIAADDGVMTRG
jgi:2-oxoglutarate ferredoxin oxidoreductase subunit gamma